MKTSPLLALLAIAAAGCSTPSPSRPDGKPLDDLLPLARQYAADEFAQDSTNLWFWTLNCHYHPEGFANDATNAVQWYTFSFFNPHTVERVPRPGNTLPTAMGYHVRITPDGELKNTSSGRGIGWSP